MLNALLEVVVAVMVRSWTLTEEARPFLGLVAALTVAVAAAYAGWHLTDRVVTRRERAGRE